MRPRTGSAAVLPARMGGAMLSEERRRRGRAELSRVLSEVNDLAGELHRASNRSRVLRAGSWLATAAGVVLIVGGLWVAAHPFIAMFERGRVDQTALAQWRRVGSKALVGSVAGPPAPAVAQPPSTGASSACGGTGDSYALLAFPTMSGPGYTGVAGDGGWDMLLQRSIVHFHGSAAPGGPGNVIIAFHREPDFKDINRLGAGDRVTVQDRACRTWTYVVRQRWVLSPDRVTQLVPTRDAELTLVTCDPWFQDTNRIVWRATLEPASAAARAVSAAGGS